MDVLENIQWFGHASFMLCDKKTGNRMYYIDPFDLQLTNLEKADLIFITHAHIDHCSLEDVKKILKDDSVVIAPQSCLEQISLPLSQVFQVNPNETYTVKNFTFSTIPAYNTHTERLTAHPKKNNWVGYIIAVNDVRIYHAGDTDFIPEMEKLKDLHLDIAMLPIGGRYTMDVKEAGIAANAIAAKITIPMHYKRLLGDRYKAAEEEFKSIVTNSTVVILNEVR